MEVKMEIFVLVLVVLVLYDMYRTMRKILKSVEDIAKRQKSDESLLFLGISYEYGDGVERDLEKAMQCYKKAYELGNVNAYERYLRLKKQP